MKKNPTTIIAFFGRNREIGYVCMRQGDLVRYGVKTIKGSRRGGAFTRRMEQALLSVMDAAESPRIIVCERRDAHSCQGALGQTMTVLARQWKAKRYRVRFVSLEEAKTDICGDGGITHQALIEAMVQRHPLLWSLINGSRQASPYWTTVCLAWALADLAQ